MWCYAPVLGFEGEAGGGVRNDELESQPPSTHSHIFLPQSPLRMCVWGRERGGPPVSVSQLSSFSILCRRLLLTATVTRRAMIVTRGRGEGNHLQVLGEKRLWKRSAAGLELSADCAFNAPAMSSWSAARLEGQTHASATQAIQQQRCVTIEF